MVEATRCAVCCKVGCCLLRLRRVGLLVVRRRRLRHGKRAHAAPRRRRPVGRPRRRVLLRLVQTRPAAAAGNARRSQAVAGKPCLLQPTIWRWVGVLLLLLLLLVVRRLCILLLVLRAIRLLLVMVLLLLRLV